MASVQLGVDVSGCLHGLLWLQEFPPPLVMSPQALSFSPLIADRQTEHPPTPHPPTPHPKVQCAEIILAVALSTGHITSVWGSKCPKNRWHPKQKGPVFVHVAPHLDVEAWSPMENVKEEGKCCVCCSHELDEPRQPTLEKIHRGVVYN